MTARHYESPYGQDATLTEEQKRVERLLAAPPAAAMDEEPEAGYRVHPAARWFRRGPWENAAVALIAIGILMLMQPFWIALFTYSFVTILAGTIMFVLVSHFPTGE